MGKSIYDLREMLCEELEGMTERGSLSGDKLKLIDMLTHSIKSIDTIIAMESSGYSNANAYGNSNAYANAYGNSNAYTGGSYESYTRGRSNRRGRSRDDAKSHIMNQLEGMLEQVHSEKEREAIQRCMEQME